jgi:hypothetical protein
MKNDIYKFRNRDQVIAAGGSVATKTCRKCGEAKPLMHFSPRKSGSADGFYNTCRACICKSANEKTKRKNAKFVDRNTSRLA